MKLHLFAHNRENLVKVGDKVKAYETEIGTIGTGNQYFAHLHYSISDGLTVDQLRSYVAGWSIDDILTYYVNPDDEVRIEEMFKEKIDVGILGLKFLEKYKGVFHPAVDINGIGGGNSDLGYVYKTPVDGVVVSVIETLAQDGWGNMVIVEEVEKVIQNEVVKKCVMNEDREGFTTMNTNQEEEVFQKLEVKNEDYSTYKVKKRESLWRIAIKLLKDGKRWIDIYDLNREIIGDDPDKIYPGQKLLIPKK